MTFTKIVNTGIGTLVHSFAVPKGLTSERPIGISSGQIRYNTDLHIFEGYHNNVWQSLSSASAEQIYKETFNVVNAQSSFTLGLVNLIMDSLMYMSMVSNYLGKIIVNFLQIDLY